MNQSPWTHDDSQAAAPAATAGQTYDVHDFDFLAGDWKNHNRRLKYRGVGSKEWIEFEATCHAELHMGGVVNVDDNVFPEFSAMSLRLFNTQTRRWSIYWITRKAGVLSPPVEGGFTGDHGEFYGEDDDDGRPVRVRFLWTKQGPSAAHWEQAFSYDGGPWETNWTMDFTRV